MTKVVRLYVREMKAKDNKEYEQLNFDENLEQKIEDEKIQKIEEEKRQKEAEEEKRQIRENQLNILIIQEIIYQEDNLTKKDLEYIIRELYCSIENVRYTDYVQSMYQKTTRLIKKYELDLKLYDDKEN